MGQKKLGAEVTKKETGPPVSKSSRNVLASSLCVLADCFGLGSEALRSERLSLSQSGRVAVQF
jgi:hypothetical protein